MEFRKQDVWSIPNILTYVRFLCIPVFMVMMILFALSDNTQTTYLYAGFGIFVFAELTDIIDGWVARHFNMITDLGKVIDPIADKVLQSLSLIALCLVNYYWIIPFAAIIALKEIYMGVQAKYFMRASKRQVHMMANWVGKTGATINFIGIVVGFIVPMPIGDKASSIVKIIDMVILGIGCALAVFAAAQYTANHVKQLKALRASGILETLDRNGHPLAQEIAEDGNEVVGDENN